MDDLLELIIDEIHTVNGSKDSAIPIRRKIHKIKFRQEYKRQLQLSQQGHMKQIKFLDKDAVWDRTRLTPHALCQIKRTSQIKYKIMRIRAKISFLAF